MTSKNKTGDQLVASMRKSKTGSVARKTAAAALPDKPAAVKPARKAPASSASAAKKRQGDGARSPDTCHLGGRVWPD